MLDHILLEFIATLKSALESAMLERSHVEERFQVDVWLGDITFETSYSLPGEDNPPKVRVDISIEWPTWSQTSYRAWTIGEGLEDSPELALEVAIRVQGLSQEVEVSQAARSLTRNSPPILNTTLELSSASSEMTVELGNSAIEYSAEFAYDATLHIDESVLEDTSTLEAALLPLGAWLASTLVKVSDLPLSYHPTTGGGD